MTCSDFMESDQAKSTLILAWFVGFYGEEEDPQVIDLDKLEQARTPIHRIFASSSQTSA